MRALAAVILGAAFGVALHVLAPWASPWVPFLAGFLSIGYFHKVLDEIAGRSG